VLSGGYEDDSDKGETFTYSGEGGRDKSESSWSGSQCKDQEWVRGNKSLQLSQISGSPVRVVRGPSHSLHSRYAPTEGYRYDGLYKVTEATRAKGKTGYMTCQFTFERLPGQPALPNEVLRPRKATSSKLKTFKASQPIASRTPKIQRSRFESPSVKPEPSESDIRTASSSAQPVPHPLRMKNTEVPDWKQIQALCSAKRKRIEDEDEDEQRPRIKFQDPDTL